MDLSSKEKRFVSEYLVDQNATQAATRAGYSKKTARQLGARLLSKVHIKAAIGTSIARVVAKNENMAERLDATLLAMADADIRDAFNEDGTVKLMSKMPDAVAKAMSSVEVDENGNVTKFKLADKARPIELLLKRNRLLTDVHEHTGKDGAPLVPAAPKIDFSGLTLGDLKVIAGMRNGNGDTH